MRPPIWQEPTEDETEAKLLTPTAGWSHDVGQYIKHLHRNIFWSESSTYLGYLRSFEVYDLPKLLGMEDRLYSLLQYTRQSM